MYIGLLVFTLVALLVLTESFSTLMVNMLAPSPIPALLETILLAALAPIKYSR